MPDATHSITPPDIGTCIAEGWTLYRRDPWLLSGATVLAAFINYLAGWIPFANLLTYLPLLGGAVHPHHAN
jgi:hypothetical protein